MKNPFKAKSKETLQTLQQQFNQLMFELGDLHYRKAIIASNLQKLNSEINTRVQKADALGKRASELQKRIQAEMNKTIAQGQAKPEEGSDAGQA